MATPSEIARLIRQLSASEQAELARSLDDQSGGDGIPSYQEAADEHARESTDRSGTDRRGRRVEYMSDYLERTGDRWI